MTLLTKVNFEEEIIQSKKPTVIEFGMVSCGPCRNMIKILNEVENELGEKVKIGKCDVEDEFNLTNQLYIQSVPTLIIFNNGEEVERINGGIAKDKLLNIINKYID